MSLSGGERTQGAQRSTEDSVRGRVGRHQLEGVEVRGELIGQMSQERGETGSKGSRRKVSER